MAFDVNKTPDNLRAVSEKGNHTTGVFVGIIKNAIDEVQHAGRYQVWIPELGGAEKDPKYWYTVSYASPFAGVTPIDDLEKGGKGQQSYGMWMVTPDVGNQVLVCFANGDTARGYWFACIWPQGMTQMVPAIGSTKSLEGKIEPVMEYNKLEDVEDYANPPRHRFDPLADGLTEQGLIDDEKRGASSTSARRDAPSRVFGFLTPRGNSIHIDDGELPNTGPESDSNQPVNEFIRLRTRSGVGITIHETDGFIYMTSKSGKSYLEISDDGINLYSEQAVSLRTTADYNIHSNGDVNIDAGGNLNIAATGHIAMGAGKETYISAGTKLVMGSAGGSSINAGGDILFTAGGVIGEGAGGNILRNGAKIQDGIDPPVAPVPLAPERHDAPDGAGGSAVGRTIGSAMPHHQPYGAGSGGGSGSGGGGDEPVAGGKNTTTAEKRRMTKVMYDEMRRLGWSDIGAKTMIAQIGRENDYNPNVMFGTHVDKNGHTNGGMVSWQKDRRTNLNSFLKSKGVMDSSGRMQRTDDNIRAQVQFIDKEMRQSQYRPSYNAVRDSSLSYRQIEVTTSNNYERWARNGNSRIGFSKADANRHLARMDGYYNSANSYLGK